MPILYSLIIEVTKVTIIIRMRLEMALGYFGRLLRNVSKRVHHDYKEHMAEEGYLSRKYNRQRVHLGYEKVDDLVILINKHWIRRSSIRII